MKRLLIVDDDSDHRLILRTMFEANGYGCEEAEGGGEALSKLRAGKIDIVLTDLHMLGMNGLELINQMGRLTQLQNTPAILLSSQSREDIPSAVHNSGARAVIPKPYNFSKLLEEVGRVI